MRVAKLKMPMRSNLLKKQGNANIIPPLLKTLPPAVFDKMCPESELTVLLSGKFTTSPLVVMATVPVSERC